jgi:hypothetical protein
MWGQSLPSHQGQGLDEPGAYNDIFGSKSCCEPLLGMVIGTCRWARREELGIPAREQSAMEGVVVRWVKCKPQANPRQTSDTPRQTPRKTKLGVAVRGIVIQFSVLESSKSQQTQAAGGGHAGALFRACFTQSDWLSSVFQSCEATLLAKVEGEVGSSRVGLHKDMRDEGDSLHQHAALSRLCHTSYVLWRK